MSVSNRVRFEIFKRDNFRCKYCGATPEDGKLEVDHVVPRSSGGSDNRGNLVTACKKCNRGKSSIPLSADRNNGRLYAYAFVLGAAYGQLITPSDEVLFYIKTNYWEIYSRWSPRDIGYSFHLFYRCCENALVKAGTGAQWLDGCFNDHEHTSALVRSTDLVANAAH